MGYLTHGGRRHGDRPADQAQPHHPAERLRLGAEEVQQLGLLLRLPEGLVGGAAGVRRQRGRTRVDNLRRGGYKIVTSLDPKIQQIAEKNVMAKEAANSTFAHGSWSSSPAPARSRRWRSTARTRWTRRTTARTPTRPRPSKIKGNYPEHGRAAARRRRPARVPGRIDVQDVHDAGRPRRGHAAQDRVQLADAAGLAVPRRRRRAELVRRPLVPVERERRDDRRTDHVVRLRQVGQHLLRPAGAGGRRGQGGQDGRAAGPASGAPTSTR